MENGNLAHFRGSDADSLAWEETPAGAVQIVTLHERADFELFLQIMAHRCENAAIPASQGSALLDGLIDWPRLRAYLEKSEEEQDAESGRVLNTLIVLSAGAYSGIGAERVGLKESDWLRRAVVYSLMRKI